MAFHKYHGYNLGRYNLASCYKCERGTEKNLGKAVENGYIEAQHNLALLYEEEGTEKNLETAFYWYQTAIENNYKVAMYNLAKCYQYEIGTEKNLEKAFYWYQKTAENGYEAAMNNLAIC